MLLNTACMSSNAYPIIHLITQKIKNWITDLDNTAQIYYVGTRGEKPFIQWPTAQISPKGVGRKKEQGN